MKINEITNIPNTYIAVVRVVSSDMCVTTRTTISADSASSAIAILRKIYGTMNVLSLSQIVSEAPRTCQNELQAPISDELIDREQFDEQTGPVQIEQISQPSMRRREHRLSARPIPSQVKHALIQQRLTKQILQQSNLLKPNEHDLRVARNRAKTALKKTDLAFQKI